MFLAGKLKSVVIVYDIGDHDIAISVTVFF